MKLRALRASVVSSCKFFLFLAVVLWCVPAHALIVTCAKTQSPAKPGDSLKINVEFSGKLAVDGIEIFPGKGKNSARMPLSFLKSSKDAQKAKKAEYADVRLLSRKTHDLLAGLSGLPSECRNSKDEEKAVAFKIDSSKKLTSLYRVANVEADFDGDLIVTLGVMRSKNGNYWVSYPDSFRILDDELKKEVENKVIQAGRQLLSVK